MVGEVGNKANTAQLVVGVKVGAELGNSCYDLVPQMKRRYCTPVYQPLRVSVLLAGQEKSHESVTGHRGTESYRVSGRGSEV